MEIDGFDDGDFEDLAPVSSTVIRADCAMRVIRPRQGNNRKLQFNFAKAVLEEIGINTPRARVSVAWAQGKKAFRIKPDKAGLFEVMTLARGENRRLIRVPLPGGLFDNAGVAEPEFYVDRIGKVIIVECPALFLTAVRKLLPAPVATKAEASPSREAPRNPGAPIDDDKVLRAALGLTETLIRTIDGQEFRPAEAAFVHLLATREIVTKQAVLLATTDPEKPDDDQRDDKIVDVYLCKIRPKLTKLGISVQTDWGNGYKLSRADRTKLKNLIELARMDEAP